MESTRLFFIDEHRVFVDVLERDVRVLTTCTVCGSAAPDDPTLLAALRLHRPDVVTVEVDGLAGGPEELGARINDAVPGAGLIALTASQDRDLAVRAAAAGFDAWVPKHSDTATLLAAIDAVREGAGWFPPELVAALLDQLRQQRRMDDLGFALALTLSKREHDVLLAMCSGASSTQIAARLMLSINTVRTHQRNIFRKLQVHTALEAVNLARAAGLGVVRTPVLAPAWKG